MLLPSLAAVALCHEPLSPKSFHSEHECSARVAHRFTYLLEGHYQEQPLISRRDLL
jgi:hypothetical protein